MTNPNARKNFVIVLTQRGQDFFFSRYTEGRKKIECKSKKSDAMIFHDTMAAGIIKGQIEDAHSDKFERVEIIPA